MAWQAIVRPCAYNYVAAIVVYVDANVLHGILFVKVQKDIVSGEGDDTANHQLQREFANTKPAILTYEALCEGSALSNPCTTRVALLS